MKRSCLPQQRSHGPQPKKEKKKKKSRLKPKVSPGQNKNWTERFFRGTLHWYVHGGGLEEVRQLNRMKGVPFTCILSIQSLLRYGDILNFIPTFQRSVHSPADLKQMSPIIKGKQWLYRSVSPKKHLRSKNFPLWPLCAFIAHS